MVGLSGMLALKEELALMFIEDLSPKANLMAECNKRLTAVGWLDSIHQFPRGKTPESFRARLDEYCLNPIRRTRGFHLCPFCDNDDVRGNGEIEVAGADGMVYVAPSLISHYVVKHDYQPPKQFVDAVMATDNKSMSVWELSVRVLRLADEPTPDNQRDFLTTFVKSRIGVRVPPAFGSVPTGYYVTTSENRVSVPLATSQDGQQMLLVLADVDKLAKVEPGSTFMELDAKDIINLALLNNVGIIVQAWLHGRDGWAGIAANEVVNLSNI